MKHLTSVHCLIPPAVNGGSARQWFIPPTPVPGLSGMNQPPLPPLLPLAAEAVQAAARMRGPASGQVCLGEVRPLCVGLQDGLTWHWARLTGSSLGSLSLGASPGCRRSRGQQASPAGHLTCRLTCLLMTHQAIPKCLGNWVGSWHENKVGLRAVPRGSISCTGAETTSAADWEVWHYWLMQSPHLHAGCWWQRIPSLPSWFQAQQVQDVCSLTELKLLIVEISLYLHW